MEVLSLKLFDLDGTLLDSNGVWLEVDHTFLGKHGLPVTQEYMHTVGHSIFPVAAQFTRDYYGLDLSCEAIMAEWLSLAREAYEHHVPLKPGAQAYLEHCKARGERMALLTACVPELCHAALTRHSLHSYFENIIFAQEMGLEKRDPEVYRRAASMLSLSPADCTLYEDGPGNCAAARSVGMHVVGVCDPFYGFSQEEVRRNCDLYILSFEELL